MVRINMIELAVDVVDRDSHDKHRYKDVEQNAKFDEEGNLTCGFRDNRPVAVWGICHDITERQQAQEKLYQVLNYRYNARLSTVITTSYALDEMEPRISSRLVDQKISMVINITAPDYRGDNSHAPNNHKNTLRRGRRPQRWGQE